MAVSNTAFVAGALDEHFDRAHAINTLFADDESKVVYFEFDESGKYNGLSYYSSRGRVRLLLRQQGPVHRAGSAGG